MLADTKPIVEALLREYLKHAGLQETLRALDMELPRTSEDISSRNELARKLDVIKVVQRYKREHPQVAKYPSTLEIWVESHLAQGAQRHRPSSGSLHSAQESRTPEPVTTERRIQRDAAVSTVLHRGGAASGSGGTVPVAGRAQGTGSSQNRVTSQAAAQHAPPRAAPGGTAGVRVAALELEECDGDDSDDDGYYVVHTLQPSRMRPASGLRPGPASGMSAQVATGARVGGSEFQAASRLLLGRLATMPEGWKQGFYFSDDPLFSYGLVQTAGGPCGVLAAVQALLLSFTNADPSPPQLNQADQVAALSDALTFLLWQASDGQPVKLLSTGRASGAHLSYEHLQYECQLQECCSRADLGHAMRACAHQFMERDGWGVALLVLSLVLTKGPAVVKSEMDELQSDGSLIVNHAYCSQELVNLCISGRAASHVHDGVRNVDGLLLKGIERPCRVGLLTLFEWFKHVDVGTHLKHPEFPVWVVCSESHFSVLFSSCAAVERFQATVDLHYYDGLARQAAPLRLTLRPDVPLDCGKVGDEELPPLECVTRTKWPAHRLDWNGQDPIL